MTNKNAGGRLSAAPSTRQNERAYSSLTWYTPAQPGEGQFGMTTYRDAESNALIGSSTYGFNLPGDVAI